MTDPKKPSSKFNQLTTADSRYVQQIPQMSEQQILEALGYGPVIQQGGIAAAETQFRQNHNGAEPTTEKLDAVLQQAVTDKEHFIRMGATNMTVGQAYAITTASNRTNVPADNIAKLAIAERAFDSGYTARNGRQPGLIQMKEADFLNTFAQYGGDCARTAELHSRIPVDAAGKPEPVSRWPDAFRDEVTHLQGDPLVSAQLGTMYAKTHPVQLDVVNTYMGETARNNSTQLGNLMRNVGGLTNGQTNIVLNPSDPEWCAATVDSAMSAAGIKPRLETSGEADPGKPTLLAADYEKFGSAIPHPSATTVRPGDVVVFLDPTHVAMVDHVDAKGNFTWLGGNQGSRHDVNENGSLNVRDSGVMFRRPPTGAFANANSNPLPDLTQPAADTPAAGTGTPAPVTNTPNPVAGPSPKPQQLAPKAPAR